MSAAAKQLRGRAARLARLMPSGPSTAARTPFVLLVVLLLGGGLITLLLLNSALNQDSFKLSELKKKTTELTDEQQALQRDVDSYSAPDALERRARELGMVPGGSPAFLNPDGTVRGVPRKASGQPTPDPSPMENQDPVAQLPPGALSPSVSASPQEQPPVPAPQPLAEPQPQQATPTPRAQPSVSRPTSKPAPPTQVSEASRTPAKPTPTTPGR
jgi:hypothetical protein